MHRDGRRSGAGLEEDVVRTTDTIEESTLGLEEPPDLRIPCIIWHRNLGSKLSFAGEDLHATEHRLLDQLRRAIPLRVAVAALLRRPQYTVSYT